MLYRRFYVVYMLESTAVFKTIGFEDRKRAVSEKALTAMELMAFCNLSYLFLFYMIHMALSFAVLWGAASSPVIHQRRNVPSWWKIRKHHHIYTESQVNHHGPALWRVWHAHTRMVLSSVYHPSLWCLLIYMILDITGCMQLVFKW